MSTTRYQPYPEYKDSGVEWLGEIPTHWDVTKLAWLIDCLDGRRVPLNAEERGKMQGEYPYWGANSIVDYVDRWLFDEELVLLGEDGAPFFDRTKPVAFHVNGKIWVNNHAHVLRPRRQIAASFLAYALNCVDFRAFIDGTTRDKLTQSDMSAIPVQCPALDEQRAIAAFLDRETARIDALVAKKERLIALLQEQRTALITRAVTKGLDPTVPMKDSGVEWLGEIPAHWEVRPLKHITSFTTGWTPPTGREDYYGGEHYWANISDLGPKLIASTEKTVTDAAVREARLQIVPQGSLLFSFKLSVGQVSLTAADMYTNEAIASFEPSERIDTAYLYWAAPLLLPKNAQENIYGAPLLSRERIANALVLSPPLDEQRSIAAYLENQTDRLDALVDRIRDAIAGLRELRTALISAAVSGKIDVRSHSGSLTDADAGV